MTPTIATLALAVCLALAANACGSHAAPKPAKASTRTHASGAPTPSAGLASPSPTASDNAGLPAGAAYDKGLGGAFQVVDWRVSGDRRKVFVVLAARHPAVRMAVRLTSEAGRLDVELSDTRVQDAAVGKIDKAGRGAITAARFVFPPDDSLVLLRVHTADSTATPSADLSQHALSGRFLVLGVALRG